MVKKIKSLFPYPSGLLLGSAWLLIIVVYYPARGAGFIADFLGLYKKIEQQPFWAFINRQDAEVESLYQFTQLQLYLLIRLFGAAWLPWFLLFTLLHTLNAFIIFRFFERLFHDFSVKYSSWVAASGVLLFFLHPAITEVTIWKAGYHYLTAILMQFFILFFVLNYLKTNKRVYVILSIIIFFFSIFSLELFYLTPPLVFLLVIGYRLSGKIDRAVFKQSLIYLVFPLTGLFIFHLLLYRFVYGHWIPHYGATSTFTTDGYQLLARVGKYLYHTIFFGGSHSSEVRKAVYEFVSQPIVGGSTVLLLLAIPVFICVHFRRRPAVFQVTSFILAGMVGSLILIAPIYFDDLFPLYNSRRCYALAIFTSQFTVLVLLWASRGRRSAFLLGISIWLLTFVYFTVRRVQVWQMGAYIQHQLFTQFKWYDARRVFILNLPSYYQDVRIIAANDEQEFVQQAKIFGYPLPEGEIIPVSSFNMNTVSDGAHVSVLDSNTLRVTLNEWGTWWMYNYQGAESYETPCYQVEITDPGHEYLFHLKKNCSRAIVLFFSNGTYHQVNFNAGGQ